jgi:t-SNARE complex subunit (syntaxin)
MKNIKSFEDFINESKQEEAINEASISSVSNKLEKTMLQMKKLVGNWSSEKDEAKKAKIKEQLRDLTDKKKELEKDLTAAIEDLDKDAELKAED